jgi:RimJ/RimL family protein N-acetyltransferase
MVGEIVVMPKDGAISLGYTFSYRHHRKGYAYEALSALIEVLHERFPEWEFICFTEPENEASMALLRKLGYKDLGYSEKKTSQVFGKFLKQ